MKPHIRNSKVPSAQVVFELTAPASAAAWLQGPHGKAAQVAIVAALNAIFGVAEGVSARLRVQLDESWTLLAVTAAPGIIVTEPSPDTVKGALVAAVAVAHVFEHAATQFQDNSEAQA